jgi:hydroxymethylbilane synthase
VRKKITLGSRGSALALAQVRLVEEALRAAHGDLDIEVKKITTSGDRRQDPSFRPLTGAGLKGLFTKEIQDALLAGEIDAAVHSLKDLPGITPDALTVAAVLERAPASDILIAKTACGFAELPDGARVGTSSVRRHRLLRWRRPDLRVEPLRGNVPTRLEKLRARDDLDAIVLAVAGLKRLGYAVSDAVAETAGRGANPAPGPTSGALEFDGTTFHTEILPDMPHAIGQGAIALESRADDARVSVLLTPLNHAPTFTCIRAERELLRLLNGDCTLPVGVRTQLVGDRIFMEAVVFGDEGTEPRVARDDGDAADPEAVARGIFRQLSHA